MAGNQAAITSLAAAETPAAKVGWALGVIGFSTALGRALGPVVGGALSGLTNLRVQFVTAGSIMALSMVPLLVMVRETDRRHEHSRRLSLSQLLGGGAPRHRSRPDVADPRPEHSRGRQPHRRCSSWACA